MVLGELGEVLPRKARGLSSFTKAAILFSIVSRNFLTFAVVFLLHLFFSARYDKTGLCGVTQGEKKKLLKKPLRRGPFPGSDDPSPSDSSSESESDGANGQRGIARRKKTQSHLNVKMEIDHEDKRIAGPGPSTQAHWEKQFADAICVSDDGKNFAGAPLFLEDESNCEDNQTELHRGTGRTSSPAARNRIEVEDNDGLFPICIFWSPIRKWKSDFISFRGSQRLPTQPPGSAARIR